MDHKELFDFLDEIGTVLSVDRVNGMYEASVERISWVTSGYGIIRASNYNGYSRESIDAAVDKLKENISGRTLIEDKGDCGEVEYKVPIFKNVNTLSEKAENISKKVFLGGTCNNSTWRDKLIPMLKIDYFNPVVDVWNEQARLQELHERKTCDFVLYTITVEMLGVYSIAEVVDDSNKRQPNTILCILGDGFTPEQLEGLNVIKDLVIGNGARAFTSLEDVAEFLNNN